MRLKFAGFFVSFLLMATLSNAQFKKGMRMAGTTLGTIFYNSGTAEVSFPAPTTGFTSRTTSWGVNLSPSLGWFLNEHTVAGAAISINPSGSKNTREASGSTYLKNKVGTFNVGAGGFVRNYFGTSAFLPFVHAGINLGISNQNIEGFSYGTDALGVPFKQTYDGKSSGGFFANATIGLGLTKLLTPNTGLDISAGYSYSYNKNVLKTTYNTDINNDGSIDETSPSEQTTKFTNHGFMINVGFQVFLEKRK
jgi:hypothetical protein